MIAGVMVGIALVGIGALAIGLATHAPSASAATASCTATGFYRDSKNLTAALINPSGTVSGDVDASGCDIGVFYGAGVAGTVNGADIHNATYFGVVNDGGAVTVENSSIHDIGESPLNGSQHGVGVYWVYGSSATGYIENDTIWNYQKGGIVVNGAGAYATISGNTVTGNSYTGLNDAASGGILVVGGACYGDVYTTDIQIMNNTVINNDVGVWLSNVQADCVSAPTTQTNIKVVNNTISDDGVYNVSGNGAVGYQAGVSDQGNNDKIIHNNISGAGYNPASSSSAYLIAIDASSSFTNHVKVHANVVN